jgi:hypothetical protein
VDGAPSAWAWAEALGELAGKVPPPDPEAIAPLLDPAAGRGGDDPTGGRFRLHRAVIQWLRAAAPLAVILDDLHRADGETLALLESAARDLDGVPVLLLAAYRPDEGGDRLAEALAGLARRSPDRIALEGLPATDVAALVAAELGGPADGAMVATLTDRTGGNPFYVRESARLWESEGALVALAEVPEGVRDVLRRRLARLPAPAVSVLRLAAVVGREADVDVLVGAAEADEDTVVDALETGVEAGLLGEPRPGRVRFAHALVRDTLYGDLTRLRRARMHGRVADTLRELRPDRLAALAHHYSHATGPEAAAQAIRYVIQAAEQAERRYAHDTAATLLTSALERCPDDDDLRSDLAGRLLRAHLRAGNLIKAREVRQAAIDAARAAGRDDLLVAACTAWTEPTPWQARRYGDVDRSVVDTLDGLLTRRDLEPATRIRLLDALVNELAGEDDPRVEAARTEAIALARGLGDRRLLAVALAAGLKGSHFDALVPRRDALAAELEPLARELDLPAFRWYAIYSQAVTASFTGDVPTLRERLAEGRELARRYRMPEAEAIQGFSDAMLAHIEGRFDESEEMYRTAAEPLTAAGSMHAEGFLMLAVSTIRISQGRVAELEPTLRMLADAFPDGRDALAVALVARGRVDEARDVRRTVAPLRPDYFFTVFATLRAMAVVAVGATDEAAPLIELLQPWRDQLPGALSATLVLRPVAHTLGELCRLAGRPDEARSHFRYAAEVAGRWGAAHWAEAARAAASR